MSAITTLKKRLISGGLWAVLGRLGTIVFALASNMLLARMLDLESMGAYFLAFSFISIVAIVAQFGFNQVAVRMIASSLEKKHYQEIRVVIIRCIQFSALASVVCALVLYAGASAWIAENVAHSVLLVQETELLIAWMLVFGFNKLLAECFRGLHDIRAASILGTVVPALSFFVCLSWLWMLNNHTTLHQSLWLATWSSLLPLLLSIYILWRAVKKFPQDRITPKKHMNSQQLLRMAWPLMLINLTVFSLTQADLWIVGLYCTTDEVALYGAASRIAVMMLIITTLLQAFMPPIIAQFHTKGDMNTLQNLLQAGACLNTILVLPVLFVLVCFPSTLLSLLYGEHYAHGSLVMSVLAVGLFFNVITGMRGYVLMMTGYERSEMSIAIVGGMINILFCIIGALQWGFEGVAVGAMLAMVLQCLCELLYVKKQLGIWTWASSSSLFTMSKQLRNA